MSALGGRLRKLEDRFGFGKETFAQLHLRAVREAEHRGLVETGELAEVALPDSEAPLEACREMLLGPRRLKPKQKRCPPSRE
jgi:hypothetical protein